MRLTLWYAAFTALTLAVFALATYEVVEHRLAREIDRQLRIDFDLVEAQLDRDPSGKIIWLLHGAHGDEGFVRLAAWFEVWSEEGKVLLRHWPVPEAQIRSPLPSPSGATLRFYGSELEEGLHVRVMERPARIHTSGVILRLFRDETEMRQTLREIIEVFALVLPFAVLAASLGGYIMARRALRPVAAMVDQAQRITSESLAARLPNPNPADEFGQLATVFNNTLERLESSFAELKRFTADASHELRTPLTALRAVGEVALHREHDPKALREAIASMLEETQRLDALTESLLTLARLESSQSLRKEPVNASELVREICDSLSALASEKHQTFEQLGEPSLVIRADPVLLRQALLNVAHNAIRYAPERTRITIDHRRVNREVIMSVADQGPGITPEHQARIFERFYRIDKGRSRAHGGHGLGLAIAKWSVERQGGHIEVHSDGASGSTFHIRLPE